MREGLGGSQEPKSQVTDLRFWTQTLDNVYFVQHIQSTYYVPGPVLTVDDAHITPHLLNTVLRKMCIHFLASSLGRVCPVTLRDVRDLGPEQICFLLQPSVTRMLCWCVSTCRQLHLNVCVLACSVCLCFSAWEGVAVCAAVCVSVHVCVCARTRPPFCACVCVCMWLNACVGCVSTQVCLSVCHGWALCMHACVLQSEKPYPRGVPGGGSSPLPISL